MDFSVIYFGGEDRDGKSCYIHKAGCRDILKLKKEKAHYLLTEEIAKGSLQDAIDSYLDEELKDMGYDENIIKVFSCAK